VLCNSSGKTIVRIVCVCTDSDVYTTTLSHTKEYTHNTPDDERGRSDPHGSYMFQSDVSTSRQNANLGHTTRLCVPTSAVLPTQLCGVERHCEEAIYSKQHLAGRHTQCDACMCVMDNTFLQYGMCWPESKLLV